MLRRSNLVGLLIFAVAAAGCSEKPLPQSLVWEQNALPSKCAVLGVAAVSNEEALAVGYRIPEFSLIAQPVCWQRAAGGWVELPVPGHGDSYFQLYDLVRDDDGVYWACGAVFELPGEPSTAAAVVYRCVAGVWSEVPLDLPSVQHGVVLQAIATAGRGARLELRAVGYTSGQEGVAIRCRSGRWEWMPVPPPGPGLAIWGLAAVGRSPGGEWYAAGARGDAPGGAAYADRGRGWEPLAGPLVNDLQFTDLAFDADGLPWFTANIATGDTLEGVLYALRGGSFVPTPVTRQSRGKFRLMSIGFDRQGHGWVGGGRAPDDPFLAGDVSATGTWIESLTEQEPPGAAPAGGEEGGGEICGISVFAKDGAFAVGQAEESDAEGNLEFLPRIFQLIPKPVGEIDAPKSPVGP